MKITGIIDIHDQIVWLNWRANHVTVGKPKHPWRDRLIFIIIVLIPPLYCHFRGLTWHFWTYFGALAYWFSVLIILRIISWLFARRETKQKGKNKNFLIEAIDKTVQIQVSDTTYGLPQNKVRTIRLKKNLIVIMDDIPIYITPKSENIDGDYTIDDIENMIKEGQ